MNYLVCILTKPFSSCEKPDLFRKFLGRFRMILCHWKTPFGGCYSPECVSHGGPKVDPEVLQSGFSVNFFLARRIFGKLPANFSAHFDGNFSAKFDGKFFPQFFPKNSRPKFTPRIVGIPLQFHFLEPPIFCLRGRPTKGVAEVRSTKISTTLLGRHVCRTKLARKIFSSHKYSHEKCSEITPKCLSLYFMGPKKHPAKSCQISCKIFLPKIKKNHRRASAGEQGEYFVVSMIAAFGNPLTSYRGLSGPLGPREAPKKV